MTGRFNRLDPFFGNSQDPQSFHKYLYVHGDPIQGVDPSGLFITQLYLRTKQAATNLAAYASIYARLASFQLISRFSLAWNGVATQATAILSYYGFQFAARFPTWIPRIEQSLDIIDLGLATLDGMSEALRATADLLDELAPIERGRRIENIAGGNLTGNVSGIDDFRYLDGEDTGFATSIRSHDNDSAQGLLNSIRKDLYELYDKSRRTMHGYDDDGVYREFDPDEVGGRGLLVAIPEGRNSWIRQISDSVRQLADATDTIVRVTPVKNWRGRRR